MVFANGALPAKTDDFIAALNVVERL